MASKSKVRSVVKTKLKASAFKPGGKVAKRRAGGAKGKGNAWRSYTSGGSDIPF